MSDSNNSQPISWAEYKERIKSLWFYPFHFIEWVCEHIAYRLECWAFLQILDKLGRLTVLVVIVTYFMDGGERTKQKHYQAWQVIHAAKGRVAGGRIEALRDLHSDNVSLDYIDLHSTSLESLDLSKASIYMSNLSETVLIDVDFSNSVLSKSTFYNAELSNVVFQGADLSGAILEGMKFLFVNDSSDTRTTFRESNLNSAKLSNTMFTRLSFEKASLIGANLTKATFFESKLREANLSGADLSGASFIDSDLSGASLHNVKNWEQISNISSTYIYNVKNPPKGFVSWALENGAYDFSPDDYSKPISSSYQKNVNEYTDIILDALKTEDAKDNAKSILKIPKSVNYMQVDEINAALNVMTSEERAHAEEKLLELAEENAVDIRNNPSLATFLSTYELEMSLQLLSYEEKELVNKEIIKRAEENSQILMIDPAYAVELMPREIKDAFQYMTPDSVEKIKIILENAEN